MFLNIHSLAVHMYDFVCDPMQAVHVHAFRLSISNFLLTPQQVIVCQNIEL